VHQANPSMPNGYSNGEFPTRPPAGDYLNVTPGPSRRASAPPLWLEEAVPYNNSPPGASPEEFSSQAQSIPQENGEAETRNTYKNKNWDEHFFFNSYFLTRIF